MSILSSTYKQKTKKTKFRDAVKTNKSANDFLKLAFKTIFTAFLLFIAVVLAIFPQKYISVCSQGIKVWAISVLPSLLPFFFLTTLMVKTDCVNGLTKIFSPITKYVFKCPEITAYPFVMSMLSGYPIGCKILADLHQNGQLDSENCKKASVFCSTSGPMFIIGAVGVGMFNSSRIGKILYVSHALAAIILGFVFSFKKTENSQTISPSLNKETSNVLYDCAYSSVISACVVGAFISIFFVFTYVACDFRLLTPLTMIFKPFFGENVSTQFCKGIIECTQGAIYLSKISGNLPIILTSFLISFGGISVICQSSVYLKKAEVPPLGFVCTKLLHGLLSAFITALILFLF